MDATKILAADILDILFDGKNKDYGAYELRKNYQRRLGGAILLTGAILGLLIAGYYLSKSTRHKGEEPIVSDYSLSSFAERPPTTPVAPRPIMQKVATLPYTIPRIMPNDQVKNDDAPPDQSKLEYIKIGSMKQSGDLDGGLEGPTDAAEKGIVATPKREKETPDFIPIENESQYPGGMEAWQRYLNKNLHYPEAAIDIGIEGDVIVQFIVDMDGNISNVEVVSGPDLLRDEAARVIRKSGHWIPALQNGRHVRSIKKQPIKFRLESQ